MIIELIIQQRVDHVTIFVSITSTISFRQKKTSDLARAQKNSRKHRRMKMIYKQQKFSTATIKECRNKSSLISFHFETDVDL